MPAAGTKRDIIDALARKERNASDLARDLGVSATAVRQHLGALSARGLVERRRRPSAGPARPTEWYRLSARARELLPKRYDLLAREMLAVLAGKLGDHATLDVVREAAARLADQAAGRLTPGDWRGVLRWLEREFAWAAEEQPAGQARCVAIHQCPFSGLGAARGAVCGAFFPALLERLLPGRRVAHASEAPGEACCAFQVTD